MSGSTPNTAPESIHVAVGVIRNDRGDILITRRPDHVHQGGLWEFPGGKREPGEAVDQALRRELREELGITLLSSTPLMRIQHRYPDRRVILDVYEVEAFLGQPHGREEQPLVWVRPEKLDRYPFPEANRPILNRLCLPPWYAVLEGGGSAGGYRERFHTLLEQGVKLIYWRGRDLSIEEYTSLTPEFLGIAGTPKAKLMIRGKPFEAVENAGLHLSSRQLQDLKKRPSGWWKVSAACHNLADLRRAQAIGLDFVVLSPVLATATHPAAIPLGWTKAAQWISQVALPIYLMGGLHLEDLETAKKIGAQGIAGIRLFLF